MAITTRDGKTQTVLAEINMIPFIDVMLVLLIIFMITAPVIQSGIEVDVPQTKQVRELSKDYLVVTIDKNEELYLQNNPVNIHEIAPQVKARLEAGTGCTPGQKPPPTSINRPLPTVATPLNSLPS